MLLCYTLKHAANTVQQCCNMTHNLAHNLAHHVETPMNSVSQHHHMRPPRLVPLLLTLLFLLSLASLWGCGSSKPIDWDARVGVYTLQQAIEDYGEPEGYQELANGNRLYLWYDAGRRNWYNVVGLIFDPQDRLVKVERNERD